MTEHADSIASLTIGALPADEARLVTLAIEQRPDLDTEAEPYRKTARLMMDAFPAVEPNPDVWQVIERGISERGRRPPARPGTPWRWLAATAALVAVLIAATLSVSAGDRSPAEMAEALASTPGSRTMSLADPLTGTEMASLIVGADGAAYLMGRSLDALGSDRTYQLWSVVGGEVVSAGLLGPSPGVIALRIEADPEILAITPEQAGGVVVSEQDPVAVWKAEG